MGFQTPGLSRRVRRALNAKLKKEKKKEKEKAKQAGAGKGKAKETNPPRSPPRASSSHDNNQSDSDDKSDNDNQSDNDDRSDNAKASNAGDEGSAAPPKSSKSKSRKAKSFPGEKLDPERLQCWEKLFAVINEALHIVTMIIERVNPDLARLYHRLSETLKADTKKHGEFLSLNECCLPGIAVHFNMAPEDGDFHWDRMSMCLGWESISTNQSYTPSLLTFNNHL